MSKIIHSLVQASIDSKNYSGVMLARLEFGSPVYTQRFATSYQSIYWDEDGGGEEEYLGVGKLASIGVLPETGELGAIQVQLTLAGMPNEIIQDVFSDTYRNQPVYLWYGTLDKDTLAVEGGETGPVLVFAGMMDYATVEFGATATITVNATSRLADWERNKGGTFNNSYQRSYVDPTDHGFENVVGLQNREISWGRYTVADPETIYKKKRGGGRGR